MMSKIRYLAIAFVFAQILLIVFTMVQRLQPRDSLNFSSDDFFISSSSISAEPGFYIDSSYDGNMKKILSPSFILDRGVYQVTLNYETNNTKGTGMIGCWSQVITPPNLLHIICSPERVV